MSSTPARSSITSPALVPSRSLLSRLKSPLQSKTRNFTDFYVQLDDPHRQYSPGDLVSGSVVLKVVKPVRITHLMVVLHGYVQVYKNPNSPGDGYRSYTNTVGSGKGKKGGSYFGNGFASLFEKEYALCGDGRLVEGVYRFNFELEFPSKGLPSSIDFERGTISYMITSTLTRSTTISPTTICDTKVHLMENIDIAPIDSPKPRLVSLQPISKRSRTKVNAKRRPRTAETVTTLPDGSEPPPSGRVSELSSVGEESDTPHSPTPSDVSFDSQFSGGTGSLTEYGVRTIGGSDAGTPNGSQVFSNGKSITATIHMLKGGFLRGDQIPIRIGVQHTKHVKSLHGIILTLYRQARVDMHPVTPIGLESKGDKGKSEDYYPKSRTGLGGLSLSGTGSSHLFRKDLSQSFAPLFVDPRTLTAEVKAAVRVPEEAFPTISNVPGAMISFKYFVEVIVDIQGRLTGLDRMFPSSGLVSVPTTYGTEPGFGRAEDATGSIFSTWGGNFLDTDTVRREKGIISCTFEIVVGTRDSERKGKKRQEPEPSFNAPAQDEIHPDSLLENQYPPADARDLYNYDQHDHYYGPYGYPQGDYPLEHYEGTEPPPSVPPPNAEREEDLPEKERLRRAEARLLPSQPPVATESSSHLPIQHHHLAPSAPLLPEDDDLPYTAPPPSSPPLPHSAVDDDAQTIPGPSNAPSSLRRHPSSTPSTIIDHSKPLPPVPGARETTIPDYAASSSHVPPTDDKLELQRRRLHLERSAPPEDQADDEQSPPGLDQAMQAMSFAPSAPVLEEEDEGLVGPVQGSADARHGHGSVLPPYER